jgi:hypothetical protein
MRHHQVAPIFNSEPFAQVRRHDISSPITPGWIVLATLDVRLSGDFST